MRLGIGFWVIICVVAAIIGGVTLNKVGVIGKAKTAISKTVPATPTVTKTFEGKEKIRVAVVTWGGYAGGQFFNNGFKASKQSRFYTESGVPVEFILIDDYAASRQAFKAGKVDLLWTTADSYPTEVEAMREYNPKVVFQADWSRGGDAFVAVREIKSVKDLRGKRVAVAFGTPSHTLLMWTLKSANMTVSDVQLVEVASAIDAAQSFKSGNCDAAVVWSPDDDDCIQTVPGAHVLLNTKTAGFIIADVFYGRGEWVDSHQAELKALYEGWMRGAAEINSSPEAKQQAAKILADGLNQPVENMLRAINNVRLTTHGDNLNFFGLMPGYRGVQGEELYRKTGAMYAALTPPLAPTTLPPWRSVIDLTAIRETNLTGSEHAAEGQVKFAKATPEEASAPALSSKAITVNFATGSALLTDYAKSVIDESVADIARTFPNARVRIEGNTDDVGSAGMNRELSYRRANAVADYLVATYGFSRNRFVVIGNGPDKPVADNTTDDGRARNRRTDFELLTIR